MDPDARLSAVASLIADRHRAQILLALLNGRPQSGSALAEAAGISRSLASAHLKKLVAGGLVRAQACGRQRLHVIASQPVADALEALVVLSAPSQIRSLREAARAKSLRWARMCYDHMAGVVAVAVAAALLDRGLVGEQDGVFTLTPASARGFAEVGIDVAALDRRNRPLLRPCLDWSERQHHLAGSLGAALTGEMMRRGWLRGVEASRIVAVTPAGAAGLLGWLGLDVTQLTA